jgi:hypothetical protein
VIGDLPHRQDTQAGRRQLEGQRDAVESPADRHDGRRRGLVEQERGLGGTGAVVEQRHRGVGLRGDGIGDVGRRYR